MIKKITVLLWALLAILPLSIVSGQDSVVVDFEDFNLPLDTFWNGNDSSGGFYSKGVFFPSSYNFQYDFWSGGWAVSTMRDTQTAGFQNLYGCIAGIGAEGSTHYAIGQQNARITQLPHSIRSGAAMKVSIFITNTTYAALSMSEGDQFAKKFGGEDGTDPDYFLLKIYAFRDGALDTSRYVPFYLADYRSEETAGDYIVRDWRQVDLTPLTEMGGVDSLQFVLESSDTSQIGYNTPLFFAVDHLVIDFLSSTEQGEASSQFVVSPNPAHTYLSVFSSRSGRSGEIVSLQGQRLQSIALDKGMNHINIQGLANGLYIVAVRDANGRLISSQTWIKQ